MINYYDFVVNFDDVMYYFYEWNEDDSVDYIKSMPLIKVCKKTFKNILLNKIKLSDTMSELVVDKTILVNGNYINALLISDGSNIIVLKFNNSLEEIGISTLEVSIDLDILELCFSMKNYNLDYECINTRNYNLVGRKDNYIKKYINIELDELYSTNNKSKLYYFYKELFLRDAIDLDSAYNDMKEHIDNCFSKDYYYLYDLMILSHKKSGLSS